jgi:hypothetical protein
MIKLAIEDFIYEIKEELECYEDIGTQGAEKWAEEFKQWLNSKGNKKNIDRQGDECYYIVGDESEIFDIADEYLDAIEQGSVKDYWKKFQ